MIAVALIALFAIASLASVVALADSAYRARHAFASLSRERALAKAGFVPHVQANEIRLRPATIAVRGSAARPFARHLPQRASRQLSGAAA
jgi:hypothetical protein